MWMIAKEINKTEIVIKRKKSFQNNHGKTKKCSLWGSNSWLSVHKTNTLTNWVKRAFYNPILDLLFKNYSILTIFLGNLFSRILVSFVLSHSGRFELAIHDFSRQIQPKIKFSFFNRTKRYKTQTTKSTMKRKTKTASLFCIAAKLKRNNIRKQKES